MTSPPSLSTFPLFFLGIDISKYSHFSFCFGFAFLFTRIALQQAEAGVSDVSRADVAIIRGNKEV